MSLKVLDIMKEAEITMLILPLNSSHKLQPLDVTVYKPFKSFYYSSAVDTWVIQHPGTPMTFIIVLKCVQEAYIKGMKPVNILAEFKRSKIVPLNKIIPLNLLMNTFYHIKSLTCII